jgi:hypothetical protein
MPSKATISVGEKFLYDFKATISVGEKFLYDFKAGPAGGRLRRPPSARCRARRARLAVHREGLAPSALNGWMTMRRPKQAGVRNDRSSGRVH